MRRTCFRFFLALLPVLFALTLLAPTWPFPSPAASPASAANASAFLTIAFWNVRWFPGGRPNAYRGEEVRQVRSVHHDIVKLNADIIGFEEVRDWPSAELAVKPLSGFKVDVCSNFPPREGQTETQQVAIASRLEPMSAWSEPWKTGSAITPPRGFAFAAYALAPQKLLLVYALHLKSNRGELVEDIAIREESMRQLLPHIKDMERAYGTLGSLTWVVGGDFNTAPDDTRFLREKTLVGLTSNGFRWSWEKIPIGTRITLPPDERFPAACFDHIFYRGTSLKKADVLETASGSSDHRAIRAVFDLLTR